MKKILSIDGGGIRGIIPGQILVILEEKLQKATGNPEARLAAYFDFFAGTSTGGILISILLCPSKTNPSQPRFSAREAVDLYIKNGRKIFDLNLLYEVKTMDGVLGPKYEVQGMEDCLKQYYEDIKLSQLIKPCIITAYDIGLRQTKFFAQHDYAKIGNAGDFLLRDVCRATSAAPTYFEPELVTSFSGESYACVDGGVFANNPALCAYSEVRNAKGDPSAKDMFLVSIGTGSQQQPYSYQKAKNWGSVGWVKPVIDIMMSGAAEVTNYHMIKMFSAQNNHDNYIRIQPSSLGSANPKVDDASPENIDALIALAIETADNCPELDRIISVLQTQADPVEF